MADFIIRGGKNLVSSTEELLIPIPENAGLAARIDRLAREKGVTVLGTGVNPGFVMDALPLTLTGVCQEVREVHVERVVCVLDGGNDQARHVPPHPEQAGPPHGCESEVRGHAGGHAGAEHDPGRREGVCNCGEGRGIPHPGTLLPVSPAPGPPDLPLIGAEAHHEIVTAVGLTATPKRAQRPCARFSTIWAWKCRAMRVICVVVTSVLTTIGLRGMRPCSVSLASLKWVSRAAMTLPLRR